MTLPVVCSRLEHGVAEFPTLHGQYFMLPFSGLVVGAQGDALVFRAAVVEGYRDVILYSFAIGYVTMSSYPSCLFVFFLVFVHDDHFFLVRGGRVGEQEVSRKKQGVADDAGTHKVAQEVDCLVVRSCQPSPFTVTEDGQGSRA